MSLQSRVRPSLRRPIAIASTLALTAGLALSMAPNASATSAVTCEDSNLDVLARATGGERFAIDISGTCYVLHMFTSGVRPAALPDPVVQTFTVTSSTPIDVDYVIVGGGGGGGAGSTWADTTKAPGPQPDSGGGAGGGGGEVVTGSSSGLTTGDHNLIVGLGGFGGNKGNTTTATSGGQGSAGGASSFDGTPAAGGTGGFGGGGDGTRAGGQTGDAADRKAAGQYGGDSTTHLGGERGSTPTQYAAPGGAGAGGSGQSPTGENGGNGGIGASSDISGESVNYGGGGGGSTLHPASPPVSGTRSGGSGGIGGGAAGNSTGDGFSAPDGFGGGGGGGRADGDDRSGSTNAGYGGTGGSGVVMIRYLAATAPGVPSIASVEPGDGQVTITITPLAETPVSYTVRVSDDESKFCTITPPETSCVIDGLTNDQEYTFVVVAGNALGESSESTEPVSATPTAPTTTTVEPTGELPYTGSDSRGMVSMAMVLVAAGAGITLVARRRRSMID